MTELIPLIDPTPEDWRKLFTELRQNDIDNIIRKGGYIRQLHDAVTDNPQRWGMNWASICRQIIGMDHSAASQYETIWKVLGGDLDPRVKDSLPERAYTLYLIARAVDTNLPRVERAVVEGAIHTAMSQKEAKHFLDEVMAIEEEHEEVREVKEVKKPLQVRTYPDDMIKRKIESDIATMRQLYGDTFLQLLRMRRDFAEEFGVIQKWDTSFDSKDVTVLLKLLLDD